MPTVPEIVILLLVIAIIFGVHKMPDISRAVAKLRLGYDKGISEDAIEVAAQNGDHGEVDFADTDSEDRRSTS